MARQVALTSWPASNTAKVSFATGEADNIVGSVFADQPGTLYIEQSGDNTNFDVSTSYSIAAGTGSGFTEQVLLNYARVRFVPTSTNPTTFRLYARATSSGTQM